MTFKELLQFRNNKYPIIKALADVMTNGQTSHMKRPDFEWYISHNDQFFYKKNDSEIEDLVYAVNKMVKDKNCPHNIRQNFYLWKHRYIKRLIEQNRIERTVESEKLYHFFVRNGHDYHQLKNTFSTGVPNLSNETEIYNPDEAQIMHFDQRIYKECVVQLMLFLNFDNYKATDKLHMNYQLKKNLYDEIMRQVTGIVKRRLNESVLDDLKTDDTTASKHLTDNIGPEYDFSINVEMYVDLRRPEIIKRYRSLIENFRMFLGNYAEIEIKPLDKRFPTMKDLYIRLSDDTSFTSPRRLWTFLKALINWIPGSQEALYFFNKDHIQVGGQINDLFKNIESLSNDEYTKRLQSYTKYYAPVFELFGFSEKQTWKWVKSMLDNHLNESVLDNIGKQQASSAKTIADESWRRAVNDSVEKLIDYKIPDIDLKLYTAIWKPDNKAQLRKAIEGAIKVFGNEYPLNWVDVSGITNMAELFAYTSYNGDISKWDTSNVTIMKKMFMYAKNFNTDISKWDVSKVYDMEGMFFDAESFTNYSLNDWDVSNVVNMGSMFYLSSYDKPLNKWDVSSVQNMTSMFQYSVFDQDISMWDISSLNLSAHMFASCPIKKEYCPRYKYLNY